MATIAMMVGGAIVNALAFSGSNFLFSSMRESNAKEFEEERKRHNEAMKQLQAAQSQYTRQRMKRLDFIHEKLLKEGHSLQTFKDVESAMHEYYLVYGKKLDPIMSPTMSQFYTPSEEQKNREVAFVIMGLTSVLIMRFNDSHKSFEKKYQY